MSIYPYEIVFLAPAQRDLARLKEFLKVNSVSEKRCNEIITDIVKKIRILADNPHVGFSFGGKYGFKTPYRGLVCGKYIAVYEAIDNGDDDTFQDKDATQGRVEIRRIYHGREDYISQLMNM
jgi:plasmid stabilization system protein ParE